MKELYILIGSSYEPEQDEYLKSHYYKRPPELANVFYERTLLNGFGEAGVDTFFISAPEVGTFPFSCHVPKLKKKDFRSQRFSVVSYYTVAGIKHFSKASAIKRELFKFLKKNKKKYDSIVILLCESYWPYLVAAKKAKKRYGIKVILMVPDLPRYVGNQANFIKRLYVEASNSLIKKMPDGYVFFANSMLKEPYINKDKPYIISEGISSYQKALTPSSPRGEDDFILYAGSVSFANGMELLLEAYQNLPLPKPKLLIVGSGDALKFIKKKEVDGVEILGLISKAKVDELMKKARLFVSPRTPDSYCSYSFPSKVINYLAYRIPLVSFRLDCYPPELSDVICYPKGVNARALSEAMSSCLNGEWIPNEMVRDAVLEKLSNVTLVKSILSINN